MASPSGLRGKVALIVTQNSGPSLDVSVALAKLLLQEGCVVRMAGQTTDLEFAAMSQVGVRDESKFSITELDPEVRPGAVASFVDDFWSRSRQPLHYLFLVALHHEESRVQNEDYEKCFACVPRPAAAPRPARAHDLGRRGCLPAPTACPRCSSPT